MPEHGEPDILARVPETDWDNRAAIDYEVAQDTISRVMAACTAAYWEEGRKASPDPIEIQRWKDERASCVRASQDLRADDAAAVADVISYYRRRLRELIPADE